MTSKNKLQGFTIVELLVVIVVIGILAAITMVSYGGVTAKANTTKAQANARSAMSVAEVFFTDVANYPRISSNFTTGSTYAKLPAGITILTGANVLSSSNGTTAVHYQYCGTIAAPAAGAETGARIRFWDFNTNAISTTIYYMGTASATGGGGAAPCHTWVTPAS